MTRQLFLAARGVGGCNAGPVPAAHQRAALALLGVPPGHRLCVVVGLGDAAPGDQLAPEGGIDRRPLGRPPRRKPVAELVHDEPFGRRDRAAGAVPGM